MSYDRDEVAQMPLSRLAELFSKLIGQKVRRFPDRKAALRRVYAALDAADAAERARLRVVPAPGKPRAARRTSFEPAGELRPPRPGSKRGRLLAALQGGGMTTEQIAAEFQWKARDVADALRLLSAANGYVVSLAHDGQTWQAAEPKNNSTSTKIARH